MNVVIETLYEHRDTSRTGRLLFRARRGEMGGRRAAMNELVCQCGRKKLLRNRNYRSFCLVLQCKHLKTYFFLKFFMYIFIEINESCNFLVFFSAFEILTVV